MQCMLHCWVPPTSMSLMLWSPQNSMHACGANVLLVFVWKPLCCKTFPYIADQLDGSISFRDQVCEAQRIEQGMEDVCRKADMLIKADVCYVGVRPPCKSLIKLVCEDNIFAPTTTVTTLTRSIGLQAIIKQRNIAQQEEPQEVHAEVQCNLFDADAPSRAPKNHQNLQS